MAATLVALAAGGFGFWLGQAGMSLPSSQQHSASAHSETKIVSALPTATDRPVAYYRDPSGKPLYSLEPRQSPGGISYVPIFVGEDVSFEDKPVKAQTTGETTPRRILYYRNPMGLADISSTPKKDSMGMDYVPVYEGDDKGTTVIVSSGKLQRTGVRFDTAALRSLSLPVHAPGTLNEDERLTSVVSLRSEAFVESVANVTTGSRVAKGEPLMRIYSPEIAAAGAQYLSIVGETTIQPSGRKALEGARQRLENLGVSSEVVAEIERTRKVPLTITWTAPRNGTIVERNVSDGMRALPGEALFRIVDHSLLWVLADVTERDLAHIAEGQTATIRARGFPGRVFTGKVDRIYPRLVNESRTARIRIELANPDGILRPAMYADVEFASGSANPVLSVPDNAVIDTGNRQIVILDRSDGQFEPREVETGIHANGFVEIRDGLQNGDRVVVSANFLIDAESNLKAALQTMTIPEAKP